MKYPAYAEYSSPQSALGVTYPKAWSIERLRFSVLSNPIRSEVANWEDDTLVSFVPMDAVGEQGGIDASQEKPIGDVYNGYTYFAEQDILIAKITPCFENGKGAIAEGLKNGVGFGTTEFHVLRPLSGISVRWLFYLTISDAFRKIGGSQMLGAGGQKRVQEDFIKDFRTGIPSYAEQQKIADFLDWKTAQIDSLIAKKRELIEKLKEKRLAVITQAVTKGLDPAVRLRDSGIPWLGKVPQHWTLNHKLGFLAASERNSFVNGPFGSDLLTTELVDEGIPVLYSGDVKAAKFNRKSEKYVTEEKARELDFCRADSGDVLLAKVGDPPGDACVYPMTSPAAVVTQDVVRIRVDREVVDPEFLSFLLVSEMGRHLVKLVSVEATRGRFSLADLKRIRFPIPPLGEQQEIARQLSLCLTRIDDMCAINELALSRLVEYRTALITAATTGKIDVRNVEIPLPA